MLFRVAGSGGTVDPADHDATVRGRILGQHGAERTGVRAVARQQPGRVDAAQRRFPGGGPDRSLTTRGTAPRRSSPVPTGPPAARSEEHTSELQSLMRISYAVFFF